ncbi:hypothetical protein ASPWEDRAFT_41342 [Aspergillus wentii DTO 134E9]|uniref:Uncharacterized protein n=1 Tax=Aspergillus wentii DTO 134E9 TaxID=1073089 RepID=A0A1L9RMC7_ASPWE|nr:uncharacterized protein ASPWEDRAFT_41342 [Aspergillus wentii DTO 134E9]KAI9929447.1 hypothetical protein MW887_000918 [Aspergillus wentii]OJJ36110.1 hypothetical protein ASPWEDRAFT_41342 [Aspergillus wentii DTO 134E9]
MLSFTFVALFLLLAVVRATSVANGQTVALNGISYFLSGIPVSNLSIDNGILNSLVEEMDIFPITIVHTSGNVQGSDLDATLANFTRQDDVFQSAFLHTVYLQSSEKATIDSQSCRETLKTSDNKLLLASPDSQVASSNAAIPASLSTPLPNGPYFVSARTGEIYRAYRLYPDDNLGFIQAGMSDEKGGYFPLPAVTENVMTKDVAVPSRLYYTPTAEQPLAGLRLGVKDIYHVKGLKTSGANRAYYYLYDTQNVTAPSVQRLFDLGAVFVGKTGTVQFANGDSPTADWVDVHCPFNPRGDGYQSPSGSSSGSGAAIASYDWLDLTVGSDTGGSMRGPAAVQGVYGNRPSTGAVSLDHVLPLGPALDTAGIFARNAALWSKAAAAWYPNFNRSYPSLPQKLYLSRTAWDDEITPEANEVLENFVQQLEKFLDVNRTVVDVKEHWSTTHNSQDINTLLNTTYGFLTSVGQYNNLAKSFFADYAAKYDGRRPFINPNPLARWNWGQANGGNVSYDAAIHNMTVFRNWWQTSGYGRHNNNSCSEGVFVQAWSTGKTDYRNRYFPAPDAPPMGFDDTMIAVFGGTPEVVVPLGESPYNSTITLHKEYLPVTVGLQAARGCDKMLAEFVADLGSRGILKPVGTGSRLY